MLHKNMLFEVHDSGRGDAGGDGGRSEEGKHAYAKNKHVQGN